ncbi:trigger factor [Lutispora saccharofermentans]|uniref:Trigger factor n=1 Tax=Lutispora saccharofermentans TaxID=3024236 RepID=A0ABT1NH33_9FIRM|nr:hypothetical protein [Lutispora saccharofermentans]MCQ1530471.1 hypothetical protein [Lutispora saccharofermentans]
MFKSKVIKIFDFKDAEVPENLLRIEVDEKEILKTLEGIAKKHAVTVEPDGGIKAGDFVMVEMESSMEKYNRSNVPIAVGAGLFDKNFEEKLINIKKNEEKIIDVDGHAVKTKILSIKRKIIPAITDELIIKENIEGVNSVPELKDHLFKMRASKLKEERLIQISYEILKEVADRSEYCIADEDVRMLCEEELDRCRILSKMEGLVFEEMSEKELGARVGFGSIEAFKEHIRKSHEKELKMALVGMDMAKKEDIIFDERSYEGHIEEISKNESVDIEIAKAMEPFFRYIAFRYTGFLRKKISEYYGSKLQAF